MNRFLLKLVLNGIVLIPLLYWFTEITIWQSILASVGLTIIAYFIGDQFILRASNNLVATISDAILAAVYLWAVAVIFNWDLNLGEILFTVAILGIAEFFFHRILGRIDQPDRQNT
ncbi:DUF2512 family protein [Brevibacillus composti]|uniref:DUF2512 family protein n=1 Tax=Brevibacillus composti TaxID=2796470 RepID=A0A7T5EPF9_9BACL|nr:DUF2512 family protein [Brevibacillus composti]QQE76345.1 DUF2512 family protein [Brevibacillus composti]QUO43372.1 DUF2512 family protein [Brevibacillus composti]